MRAQVTRARTASFVTRGGFSIIYIPLILLLLVAFVAMAVDTGRIRLAKAQLQGAADAAARAGATGIPKSISASGARAKIVADLNPVAETNVSFITASDAEWGTWDSDSGTFTVITDDPRTATDERNAGNAIHCYARAQSSRGTSIPLWIVPHVTTFDRKGKSAKLSTVSNLQAEAVAWVYGFVDDFGFVGIDGVTSHGNKAKLVGNIASDGEINLGNADVLAGTYAPGNARPGKGESLLQGPNSQVDGWTAPLDYKIADHFPPYTSVPLGAIAIPGNKKINGGSTPANAHSYYGDGSDVTITSGYVIIYQTADLELGKVTFQSPTGNTQSQAARVEFRMVGNFKVDNGNGNNQMYAHVYAPQATITMKGTQDHWGWLIGKRIDFHGNPTLNYDGSRTPTGGYKYQLVR